MKRWIAVALVPSFLSALTLQDALKHTLEANPQIVAKKSELATQKSLLQASKSGYLPKVDLSYSVGPEATKTIANDRVNVHVVRQNAAATIKENIFSGFSTKYGVKQQNAQVLTSEAGLLDAKYTTSLQLITAYVDILRKKELLKIAADNEAVHKKYLAEIKQRVDAGIGRASDYTQTLSRYENAQSTYSITKQKYQNALYGFERIYSADVDPKTLQEPKIGTLPANNLDALVAMAYKNNPSIMKSENEIKYARATIEKSNAAYYPTVDLQAQAYWDKNLNGYSKEKQGRPTANDQVENNGYNGLVVVNYNIFNGLNDKATKEANEHKLLTYPVNQQFSYYHKCALFLVTHPH